MKSIHTYTYRHAHTHTHIHIQTRMHAHTHMHIQTCTHRHAQTHTHTNEHKRTHIHTHTKCGHINIGTHTKHKINTVYYIIWWRKIVHMGMELNEQQCAINKMIFFSPGQLYFDF